MASNLSAATFPEPSTQGQIPFTPPNSSLECVTAYSIWGTLTKPGTTVPPICFHGGPGVPRQYLKPLGLLQSKLQTAIITYDQIGCGRSTHLPDKKGDTNFWTIELFIAELQNLITTLGIEKYSLFGHSWGGMLATEFALTQPAGLQKLILASSPARIGTRVEVSLRQRRELPGNVAAVMEKCEAEGTTASDEYRAANMEYLKRHLCILDPFPDCLVEAMKDSTSDNTVSSTMHGGIVVTGSLKEYDVVPRLHEITRRAVPGGVLILNGEFDGAQDEVVRPCFERIEARVKWIKFPKSSHMPFFEETGRFLEEVGNFLLQN